MLKSTRYKASSPSGGRQGMHYIIIAYLLVLVLGVMSIIAFRPPEVPEPKPDPDLPILMGEVMLVLEYQEARLQSMEEQIQEVHTMLTELLKDY